MLELGHEEELKQNTKEVRPRATLSFDWLRLWLRLWMFATLTTGSHSFGHRQPLLCFAHNAGYKNWAQGWVSQR